MTPASGHPLAAMLAAAAAGRFPAADGGVDVMAPDPHGWWAVVSFTGHAAVLADVDAAELARRGADGFGGATHPDLLRWLAGEHGAIGTLDVVLVATADGGGTPLARRDDVDDHPRVRRAVAHRRDVEVYGSEAGIVVVGRGLVGRRELSVELLDGTPGGAGHGRRLVAGGLAALAPGEPCWAQVAPGNAASLRAFLACGFVPVGSEVLLRPGDVQR